MVHLLWLRLNERHALTEVYTMARIGPTGNAIGSGTVSTKGFDFVSRIAIANLYLSRQGLVKLTIALLAVSKVSRICNKSPLAYQEIRAFGHEPDHVYNISNLD